MSVTHPVFPDLVMPESVDREVVTIWSNGIPLDGDLYRPKSLSGQAKAPAVVLGHGWGGDKKSSERYAAKFADELGAVTLCFTHNCWYRSGSKLQLLGDPPKRDENNEAVVRVRFIRDLVDPMEWLQDFRAAVDYLEGEPNVDTDRMAAWGTSFGGGIAMHHAANDARIKALVVQVALLFQMPEQMKALAKQRAIDIARGNIDPIPQGTDSLPGVAGTAHMAKLLQYDVIEQAEKLAVPTLMMDAENEKMFDTSANCGKAYEILTQRKVPTHYEVFPGIEHYDIYFEGFEKSAEMASDWFRKYL